MNSVTVSTDCPSCGAPLDFNEGSNAVTCGHCGSNLLVTGRKQLLSYSVSPKLDEHRATALAVMTQRNMGRSDFRGISARLYFIPYYRMTGQDFSWEKSPPKPVPAEDYSGEIQRKDVFGWPAQRRTSVFGGWTSVLDAAADLMGNLFGKSFGSHPDTWDTGYEAGNTVPGGNEVGLGTKNPPEGPHPVSVYGHSACGSLYENGDVLLNDRYVEKNFLACALDGAGLYSLGVRPSVLRLELFQPGMLKKAGKIVHPAMAPDEAESVGMKTAPERQMLYREVIGKMLSLVYFPFWFVEMENRGEALVTIIDAVTESVVKADAATSVYETLDKEFKETPKVVGFRPLTCPNCGWDFPVKKDNTIFFCKTCSTAWQICGSELCEVSYQVADVAQPGQTCDVQHLPFWVINVGEHAAGKDFRFFMPAFRYRRLKFLLDLGLKISRLQPSYKVGDTKGLDLSGCYYDTEDAALLARFIQAVLGAGGAADVRAEDHSALRVSGATLTWVPFSVNGAYLASPFGKISIPRNLLL